MSVVSKITYIKLHARTALQGALVLIIVVLTTGIGLYISGHGKAATGYVSVEAENGVRSGSVQAISDASASNSSAVAFQAASTANTEITVDAATTYQTVEGFGASTRSWLDKDGGTTPLTGALASKVIQAVYGQVHLTMGNMQNDPYERAPGASTSANDNTDPNSFNLSNFDFSRSDSIKKLADLAAPYGFNNYSLQGGINSRWDNTWLQTLRTANYSQYVAEAAEHSFAIVRRWQDAYGFTPKWLHLFNEPLTGNKEVYNAQSVQDIVDITKATCQRLQAAGFTGVKIVVSNDTTEATSYDNTKAILADPGARACVGAIGYHAYPYGSTYSSIANIFKTSGSGKPSATSIAVRGKLSELAKQYGIELWMTEISHGQANTTDTLRGRAIHIHDEMAYANANAYFGMFNIYSTLQDQDDHIVIFDPSAQTYRITGMGYAIGHYARWLDKGSVRVSAVSSDNLVQVTAYRNPTTNKLVVVIINNNASAQTVKINVSNLSLKGSVSGEQSYGSTYWKPLTPWTTDTGNALSLAVPGQSVTSIGSPIQP